jgi:uncharacterized protein
MEAIWDKIEPVSAMVFTLAGFGLILLMTRLKAPIWAAILAGAIAVVVMFHFREGDSDAGVISRTAGILGEGAIEPRTLAVAVIVAVMLVFSKAMRETGRIDRMVGLMRSIMRRPAVAMAALPAAIGMIPMPGGALFSAPMVATAAGGANVSGTQLSAINFWYRHPWEFWWPLYPGVILAMQLADEQFAITQGQFIFAMLPMSLAMIVGGLWVFRGSHSDLHQRAEKAPRGAKCELFNVMTPIWLVMAIFIGGKVLVWQIGEPSTPEEEAQLSFIGKYITTILAIVVALLFMALVGRMSFAKLGRMFTTWSVGKLVLVVSSAMVFMHALQVVEAGEHMSDELSALGVPIVVVVALLPFIAGFILGIAIGFVGTAFPIVLPLVADSGSPMAYVMLAYVFGHMGQMLSPIHVCQIVTLDYFKSSYRQIYPRIIPPAMFTCAAACAYFILLKWILA